MAETRKGEVTFKGNPVELVGPKLKVGDSGADFASVGAGELAVITLADTAGKARLFNVIPSLDTPVCNIQTRKFSEELQALGDKIVAYSVSLDLPFAQQRHSAPTPRLRTSRTCQTPTTTASARATVS